MASKEYQINAYITLKLEFIETVIYVDNKLFIACKSLLLNTTVDGLKDIQFISSIDELEQKLESSTSIFSKREVEISPEVRFWAHCSNIQAWAENNYDSRLLHSNLAFPLLKELVKVGDDVALKVFREEIVKRLESGFPSVVYFLVNEGYTDYISREDFLYAVLNFSEAEALFNLEKIIGCELSPAYDSYDMLNSFIIKDKQVEGLNIYSVNLHKIFNSISSFTNLTFLSLVKSGIKTIPDSIGTLKKIKYLDLSENELLHIPLSFRFLTGIEELYLDDNCFTIFPEPIKYLKNLRVLDLSGSKLEKIPNYVWNLRNLRIFNLGRNRIQFIPDSIQKLESLKELYLNDNQLNKLPKTIDNLVNLRILDVSVNRLDQIPSSIKNLDSLCTINLGFNRLEVFPNFIEDMESLYTIDLIGNNLKWSLIPSSMKYKVKL